MATITRAGNIRRPFAKCRGVRDVLRGEVSEPGRHFFDLKTIHFNERSTSEKRLYLNSYEKGFYSFRNFGVRIEFRNSRGSPTRKEMYAQKYQARRSGPYEGHISIRIIRSQVHFLSFYYREIRIFLLQVLLSVTKVNEINATVRKPEDRRRRSRTSGMGLVGRSYRKLEVLRLLVIRKRYREKIR